MARFDVAIIGTGQAGVPLARRLAARGKRVLIAERASPGGTCVNYGCTPTKTMIASARAAHVARTAGRLGVKTGEVSVDFAKVVARKDAIVRRWQEGVEGHLARPGITFVREHARFVGARTLELGGERHEADGVVIDTGARPRLAPVPGLDGVPYLDNRTVMALTALPEHLLVLGGGYIGCEFAQMFRRFGARVTVVEQGPRLLGHEDEAISTALEAVFRDEGIELVLGEGLREARPASRGVELVLRDGRVLGGSHLLVATGRRPNTDDLGCAEGGIALDEKGFVRVDDQYRTSAEGVFAVGDVTPQPQFTHTSWDDHRLLFDLLTGKPAAGRASRTIPFVVFTDPQVAGVGLSEEDAKRRGLRYEVATMPFGDIARAVEIDEPAGVMQVLIDPDSERVLGARLVGAEAGELIHIFVGLIRAGASARAIVDAEFVHPTFAEGVQSLVMRLPRYALD